ncbi:YifB family Mg chelatase-like AAA ATPase [Candidatus Uhrbacteria bacterium]|jgi:magnesium chelatase family protein|nr:YifB family Mg chelatase-like AAA ATPase [Candidatus Uhrbacteria bacterium]
MFYITSSAIIGITAVPVQIETHVAFGMPHFKIVGLPDMTVKESRDRIRAAIKQSGFLFPRGRITVNLAPADIRKQGPLYDLPAALSILAATGQITYSSLNDSIVLGELALNGEVRPVPAALSATVMAKREGISNIYVPEKNIQEAVAVQGVNVFAITSLTQIVDHLNGVALIEPTVTKPRKSRTTYNTDFKHIKGQELAKRGIEIAASGGHNILLSGPPGTGKTLLARSLPSILPELSHNEAVEVTTIASVAGTLIGGHGLIRERPFRTPHHSASAVSLVGGGSWPKPGEVSLAHRGVLFLDELPEFSRHVLEHLRQPLEDGFVTISRATGTVRFPARFLLAASMNPCPCGYLSDPFRTCECTHGNIRRYQKKISGPLLDRFDLIIDVPRLESNKLLTDELSETSSVIRERVTKARKTQSDRFKQSDLLTNSEIPQSQLDNLCLLTQEAKQLVELALNQHKLTPRGYARVRKVARTIADLEGSTTIEINHVAEALQFRQQSTQERT